MLSLRRLEDQGPVLMSSDGVFFGNFPYGVVVLGEIRANEENLEPRIYSTTQNCSLIWKLAEEVGKM